MVTVAEAIILAALIVVFAPLAMYLTGLLVIWVFIYARKIWD